jgi:hypothetical protein
MVTTPTITLDDFTPRRGIMTRYGRHALNQENFSQRPLVPSDTLSISYQIEFEEPKNLTPALPPKPKLLYRTMDLDASEASIIDARPCARRMDLVD